MGGSKKKFAEQGSYQRLKRQFCKRYGIDPRTTISRRDVIEDAAFAQYETDGDLPADRVEAVLSAIFYVVGLIASTQGIDPNALSRNANNVAMTRPQKWVEPTEAERQALDEEDTRRSFLPFLQRALNAQKRQTNYTNNLGVTNDA